MKARSTDVFRVDGFTDGLVVGHADGWEAGVQLGWEQGLVVGGEDGLQGKVVENVQKEKEKAYWRGFLDGKKTGDVAREMQHKKELEASERLRHNQHRWVV